MSRRVEKTTSSVLDVNFFPSLAVCSCIASNSQLTVTSVEEENFVSSAQTFLRKQQTLCDAAEIETLKKQLSQLEDFQIIYFSTRENKKNETTAFNYAQVSSASAGTTGQ